MKKFDSTKWITESKFNQKSLYEDQLLKEYIIDFLVDKHINQKLVLKEGLGDLLNTIKTKLGEKKKAFDAFLSALKSFKDPKNTIPILHNLKALGIDPKNEEEVETLKKTIQFHLDGKTAINIDLNEEEDAYSKKLNKAFKENPEETKHVTNWWRDNMVGKATKIFLIANILFSMFVGSIVQTGKDLGITQGDNIEVTAAIPPGPQMTAYGNALDQMGFTQPEINKELSSTEGRTLNVKAFGGVGKDTRFFINPKGDVIDVDTGTQGLEPTQGELATDSTQLQDANSQGLNIQIADDETANATLFKYGSSELTSEGKSKIQKENKEIYDILLNGDDYSETVQGSSSNSGNNPDYDEGKKELGLGKFRGEEGATFAKLDLESLLNSSKIEHTKTNSTITVTDKK